MIDSITIHEKKYDSTSLGDYDQDMREAIDIYENPKMSAVPTQNGEKW